ncbi:Zinc finger BED domain-containing protein RICESLEEPER 2 [Pseudolycoriella hygida]|uniref:Zinc finger BED domain-containing protein RICESLEEPER 2 n=1 Tax=Pseudolycoriella hygida TaxID=35572 RepID=A0A9Q0S1D6_9DIPT|nr:Zinc finger BED domain-containing protein RICESLEEPER 2 [Pseudolycoriella hygida]
MESSGEIFDSEVESSSQGDANSHTGEENHENNDDDGQNNDDDSKKKRSPIWNHFSIFTDKDGKTYARCKQSPCTNAPKDQAFVDLVKCLNPLARIVCDKTIRADLMVEYERKVEELKTELAAVPGKISITLDGWTSKHGLPFLAIRGHWVDEQWQLKSKLLDFAYIEGNHDGRNHSIIRSECLRRLNVRFSEILGITADNASSNDKLFDWLDSCGVSAVTSQVRCLAHVINLAVQDMLAALKVPSDCDPEYDESLENVFTRCLKKNI